MTESGRFRIAHLSDLHILSLVGAIPWRLLNKRLTGYANLRLRRSHIHKPEFVGAIAEHLRLTGVDHVVITGDVSNLALETEFEKVRSILTERLRLPPDQVSIVPGNHDVYTSGAARERRFQTFFKPHLRSDLPDLTVSSRTSPFPFVKLRGPVAIIGLSTAVAQPPFVAAGKLGRTQLDALSAILAHPEVRRRTPVILQHHPIHNPASWIKSALEGLDDASALSASLAQVRRGLLLHGHLHRRVRRRLRTAAGHLDVVGATSASLLHENPAKMGGLQPLRDRRRRRDHRHRVAPPGAINGPTPPREHRRNGRGLILK